MLRPARPALLLVGAVVASLLSVVAAPVTAAAAPVPTTPGAFVGLTPTRILDTRTGNGVPKSPVPVGVPLRLTVGGRGGVPADASAVVLTLTVVAGSGGGYVTAYPTGAAAPTTSVVNWAPRQTVAGSATVTLGTGGSIDLRVGAGRPVDLVADVAGYVVAGVPTAPGAYVARTPTRILDTRRDVGITTGPLASGGQASLTVLGVGGVVPSSGVSAVVGTLTAVGSRTGGHLTAWPDGVRPTTSALNYAAGQTVANQVTVPLGDAGGFSLYASGGPVDVVFDLTGYVVAGTATAPGTYVPVAPGRVYDSRRGGAVPAPGADLAVPVAGLGGLPRTGIGAVVANLTVTGTTSPGYLTAFPTGQPLPLASNLNWTSGRTLADQASLALGRGGAVTVHLAGPTRAEVVIDVSGYYLPAPPAAPTGLTTTVSDPGTPRQAVALRWTASDGAGGYVVRRAEGATAPASPTDGTAGPTVAAGTTTAVDRDVSPGATYSYAVFAQDVVPNTSVAATTTVAVPGIDPTPLHITPPVDLPLPVGAPPAVSPQVNDLDCPADGACVGVGQVIGLDGTTATTPYLLAGHDGSWTAPAVTLPAGAATGASQTAVLRSVDCSDAAACVAVGSYVTSAGQLAPLVVQLDGDTSTTSTVALPNPAASSSLVLPDVSCTAGGTCVAVGSYRRALDGPATSAAVSIVVDGLGVRLVPSAVAAGIDNATPVSVACISTTSCVAVGGWSTVGGGAGALTGRFDGTGWTYTTLAAPSGTSSFTLHAVDCSAADACTAVGAARTGSNGTIGVRAPLLGNTWAPTLVRGTPSSIPGFVQCRADVGCLAVYRADGGTNAVVTDDGSARPVQPPGNGIAPPAPVYDFACDADLRCALAGSWLPGTSELSRRALIATVVDGTPTTVQVGPVVGGDSGTRVVVNQVGCAPSGACVVSGYTFAADAYQRRFLQTFSLDGA